MRVLICGSRVWDDSFIIHTVLGGMLREAELDSDGLVVIDGVARGADTIAGGWFGGAEDGIHAIHEHVRHERYPADWDQHGKAAGPIRNARMLKEGQPDFVIGFSDNLAESVGTRDMVTRAKKAGVPCYVVSRP